MSAGRVHMARHLVVPVADGECPGRFEQQDGRGNGRVRLVFRAARDGEDGPLRQDDDALAGGLAQGDVQCAVEDEEELVGVVVHVPDVLALDLRDADVVVVDGGDDTGAPLLGEGGEGGGQGDRFLSHGAIVRGDGGADEC
nr:hypothetical protein SCGD3.04 - Streptomyces coelicolor [Streptomyces coelicolor]